MTTFIAPVRTYKFTDSRLVEIALEKVAFAERDAAELDTVGIDAAWVSDLKDSALAFAALPDDKVEAAEQTEATDEKTIDAGKVLDKLKELRSAALRAFGEKGTEYKRFGFKDLSKLTDAQLLTKGLVAHGLAVTYATPLAAKGYDATDNTELATLCTGYVTGLQNQSIEIGSRDSAQENRVTAGNELYKQLEKELCEAGKDYWRTRSAAKYNDYIIYNTASGVAVHKTVSFSVLGPASHILVEIPYRADRHFTIHNTSPVPYYLFLSNDGSTAITTKLLIGPGAVTAGVWSDLGPSGAMAVVGNDNPGMIGTGDFTYDV